MPVRRGFALPLVLWVIAAGSALAFAATIGTRAGIEAARYRAEHIVDRWLVEGCAAWLRAEVDAWMRAAADSSLAVASARWRRLPSASPLQTGPCEVAVTLRAVGAGVDINSASAADLRFVFRQLVAGSHRADSLVDALLDWRDADHIARPLGAEAPEYRDTERVEPRNGPLAAVEELRVVRGFDRLSAEELRVLFAVVAVESAPVPIAWATAVQLGLLPGMDAAAVARIEELRRRNPLAVETLDQLIGAAGPETGDSLRTRYAELRAATADEPAAWIVRIDGSHAALELRIARMRSGIAVLERRELR